MIIQIYALSDIVLLFKILTDRTNVGNATSTVLPTSGNGAGTTTSRVHAISPLVFNNYQSIRSTLYYTPVKYILSSLF